MHVTVKYRGNKKGGMRITLPIGVKKKTAVKGTLTANPLVQMEESEARKLVELDPYNFEVIPNDPPQKKRRHKDDEAVNGK